jgi:homocysteine S-methyltransferase
MTSKLISRLQQGPLLADGAMGTMLSQRGVAAELCFDELNLTSPAIVAEVHRAYIEAGAELIETNTFGSNRFKLAKYGLEHQVAAINRAAVELAQRVVSASFKPLIIAGAVGPSGGYLAPLGRLSISEAEAAFTEQIEALAGAGVDALMFETFSDLLELEVAIQAARKVAPDLPIIAQVTFANDGLTALGDDPVKVAAKMSAWGVEVVGVNCSVGPARVLRSIRALKANLPEGTLLAAQPNAGWPERTAGRLMYPATPDYFGEYALIFARAGVSLIGGCCGTTPDHIARMRHALDNPHPVKIEVIDSTSPPSKIEDAFDTLPPTQLAQALQDGRFVTSVEVQPPRGFSLAKVLTATRMLRDSGATVVNVADSPVARMRMSPWAVCHRIQTEVGLETILNFPTRGRNLLRIQGDLLGAHALNLRNLFVVMGDPTTIGDYPEAFDQHDVVSTGLIQLVKEGFNVGKAYGGKSIAQPTNFFVGGALSMNATKRDREMKLLKKKIDMGVDFVMTQPIYELEVLDSFISGYEAEYGPLEIPVLVSVLPLYNLKNARFLHNEVPGIVVPQALQDRMEQAGDNGPREGLAIAKDLLAGIREKAQGTYIMPPFLRYDLAAELLETLA